MSQSAPLLGDGLCLCSFVPLGDSDAERARRQYQLELFAELGVKKIRRDLHWHRVEPVQGQFEPEHFDTGIAEVTASGIEMIGLLAYGNPWATTATDSDKFYPPDDPADFATYARYVVEQFGDRISTWEIWNEQNSGFRFWKPELAGDPAAYGELLRQASAAIHEVQPEAVVLYGGLFYHELVIPGAETFLTDYFAAFPNGADDFDGLAYHPYTTYPPQVSPETRNSHEQPITMMDEVLRALLADNGGEHPLYATEVGWPTYDRVDAVDQAAYLVRAALWLAHDGVRSTCWYTLEDGHLGGTETFPPEDDFGLLYYDPDPTDDTPAERKPSFYALATLAETLGEMVYLRDASAELGLAEHQFAHLYAPRDGQSRVHVLWTDDLYPGSATLPLEPYADATAHDALGEAVELDRDGDEVSLAIGPLPIYVLEGLD